MARSGRGAGEPPAAMPAGYFCWPTLDAENGAVASWMMEYFDGVLSSYQPPSLSALKERCTMSERPAGSFDPPLGGG